MKNNEVIEYLNNLKKGMFCTVNIPLYNGQTIPVTVKYMGKDSQGRYKFLDTGKMIMSRSFIEQQEITIDETFNRDKAIEINKKLRKQDRTR